MAIRKQYSILTILLIIVLCANLLIVQVAHADGETPTEPPAPTQAATEPAVETTPEPVEATPIPEEATATSVPASSDIPEVPPSEETAVEESTAVTGILSAVPDETNVVVLDDEGQALVLGSQETAEAVITSDPVWCPVSVAAPTPGANGCSTSYASFTDLLTAMRTNPTAFDEAGTIFLEKPAGQGFTTPLILDNSATSLSTSFSTLSAFDLAIRGGWNTNNNTLSGQTNFGASGGNQGYILIGSATNPWVGNITLSNLKFTGVSTANALTIYTDSGNINLSNVDVMQQGGGYNTALLDSNSGNITVQSGSTFDGDSASETQGFSAATGSGSIAISDTVFKDSKNHNGATLSASTITLTNVTAVQNDGNGLSISDASLITLNNVLSAPDINAQGNGLSGVLINGTGSTLARVIGGTFADNKRYGIEIYNGSIVIQTSPTCPVSGNTRNTLGCYNVTPSTADTTAPVITPTVTGTLGNNGWYTGNVSVSWSVVDNESAISSSTGCGPTTISADTASTALTCSATSMGGTSSNSVTIKRDATAPTIGSHANEAVTTNDALGTNVTYSLPSILDNLDASPSVACSPISGSFFPVGNTTVTCNGTDQAGNSAVPTTFVVQVTYSIIPPTATSTPVSTAMPPSSATQPSTSQNSKPKQQQSSGSSALIIPLTGGELIDLDCNSVFWAFGIKLSFLNLCDQQTTIHSVGANDLPGKLPAGFSYVLGLKVDVLTNSQVITELPNGSGIEMDFPITSQSQDQFKALYWNGSEWLEVTNQISASEISKTINSTAGDGLYQLTQDEASGFYPMLTAHKTGVFVLVKK